MLELPPLSLYVHIPWCVRKCPYCDFNSHEHAGDIPEREYVAALLTDLQADLPLVKGRSLQSIFFGGGTPSLLSAEAMAELLQGIQALIPFAADCEITLEANPGTAEAARFAGFRRAGVNRLSIGVQSFDDRHLQTLGRIHDATQARRAITMARDAGFDNFNIDLMHGLPAQTSVEAMADIEQALELQPAHLSWYQLTIEPNTVFYSKPPPLPDDDELGAIQGRGAELLATAGYTQYEVSAYAQTGRASMHNMNYWQFGDYLGIGAGAHGKLTDPESNSIMRLRKRKQPAHYLRSDVDRLALREFIAPENRAFEFLLNALRLRQGVARSLFTARTGLAFSTIAKQVECLQHKELMDLSESTLATTDRGYQLLNSVLEEFLT